MNKKIYFAGSIRGGRVDADLYNRIISYIQRTDVVLTEHVGGSNLCLEEQGFARDSKIYDQDTSWLHCCPKFENRYLKKCKNMVSFGDKTIAFFDKNSTFGVKLPSRSHVDYFVLHGRNKVDVEKLLNCYVVDLLIIDGSVPDYIRERIIEKADALGQRYYDVKTAGAFVLRL